MAKSQKLPDLAVERRIVFVRGHRVMLGADLADLYGVPAKRLNEAVRRNVGSPCGFHVPAVERGGSRLEVTNRDLKFRIRR